MGQIENSCDCIARRPPTITQCDRFARQQAANSQTIHARIRIDQFIFFHSQRRDWTEQEGSAITHFSDYQPNWFAQLTSDLSILDDTLQSRLRVIPQAL